MTMPKISDVLTCGDSEYLESLCRSLLRAGFGLSGGSFLLMDPSPKEAFFIATKTGPCSATRTIACLEPEYAFRYAQDIDKGPRDDTRTAACRNPYYACQYALDVDKGPRDDTRTAACDDPDQAYYYAQGVDKGPRDDTRTAACRGPFSGIHYAFYVDRKFHPETWEAAQESSQDSSQGAEAAYRENLQVPEGY